MIVNDGIDIPSYDFHRLTEPLDYIYVSGYRFSATHLATDYGLHNGTRIYACHDGQVILRKQWNTGYGFHLLIEGKEWTSLYAHCSLIQVPLYAQIIAGQVIALGGSSGNSSGSHLHLELLYRGNHINPELLFRETGPQHIE